MTGNFDRKKDQLVRLARKAFEEMRLAAQGASPEMLVRVEERFISDANSGLLGKHIKEAKSDGLWTREAVFEYYQIVFLEVLKPELEKRDKNMATKQLEAEKELLSNLKTHLPALRKALSGLQGAYDEMLYRFYYGSFKVYLAQGYTADAVEALKLIKPGGVEWSPYFEEIIKQGAAGTAWEQEHNQNWSFHTRPFVEAFLHAKYFLEMAVQAGTEDYEEFPQILPYSLASLLCLFSLR